MKNWDCKITKRVTIQKHTELLTCSPGGLLFLSYSNKCLGRSSELNMAEDMKTTTVYNRIRSTLKSAHTEREMNTMDTIPWMDHNTIVMKSAGSF